MENAADLVRSALEHQYHAALAMLRGTIEKCPPELWLSKEERNAFWQVAYHTLYFAHLYLQPNEAAFRPWKDHQAGVQFEDGIADAEPIPGSTLPLIPAPYTKTQVLDYCDFCDAMVDDTLRTMDIWSSESGFSWYKIPKLEHQVANIRHIQIGAAQLAQRLRTKLDIGVRWVGSAAARPRQSAWSEAGTARIENLADALQQHLRSKRLLDERGSLLQNSLLEDHAVGMSRREEDAHIAARGGELLDEFRPAETRHDDVGHDEVDRGSMVPRNVHRLRGIAAGEHGISVRDEKVGHQLPHVGIVFDQEDRFGAAASQHSGGFRRGLFGRVHARKIDLEGAASPGLAVDPDISAALFTMP